MPNREVLQTVDRFLQTLELDLSGKTVLAACSGGADSMAMVLLLADLTAKYGFSLVVSHINHGIRGKEAERDAAFVAEFCARRGLPFVLKTGDAPALCAQMRTGMEDAARTLRYRLLAEAAEECGAVYIATAHTADDHLETILLHLTRGAGLAGVSGIRPQIGRILRPILPLTRADTEAVVASYGERFVTDSTNASDLYARNRIRHNVVPVLQTLNPAVVRTTWENSSVIAAENAFLDRLADAVLERAEQNGALQIALLLAEDPVLQARTVRRWTARIGIALTNERTEAMLALAKSPMPSGVCELGKACICRKRYGVLGLETTESAPESFSKSVEPCENAVLNSRFFYDVCTISAEKMQSVYKLFNHCIVNCDTINGEIKIRNRLPGDTFRPNARSGSKPLRRVMIDRKIPKDLRDYIPVVADDVGVIWVWGLGYHADRMTLEGTRWYQIRFAENTNESNPSDFHTLQK
ncbi:MAG: tRNA lysidine(34) synthetase TilS [Clostridia bacterium]|nr:tRNA lysidine(34) synthetase TilS [Clostridia bacterium]